MSSQWWTAFKRWKPIGREFMEQTVLFTQFLCSIHVFNNHVAQFHQVHYYFLSIIFLTEF